MPIMAIYAPKVRIKNGIAMEQAHFLTEKNSSKKKRAESLALSLLLCIFAIEIGNRMKW
jgi:hypothetical protein